MFTKKKAAPKDRYHAEYSKLDSEIIEAVPDIRHDVRLVAIDEQIRGFEAQQKEVKKLISSCRYYPDERPKPEPVGVEVDAQMLLDGGDREELSGPDTEDRLRNLRRQLAAIEAAVRILQAERLELTARLCAAAVIELEPLAQGFAKDLFFAYEQLAEQLETSGQFYQLLQRRGLPHERRPAHWTLTKNYDHAVLGGGFIGSSLRWYLDSRKSFWWPNKK